MTSAGLTLLLTLLWLALTGSASPANILLGLAVALACLWLLRFELNRPAIRPKWGLVWLFLTFLKELALSALAVARIVLSPKMAVEPAIVVFPLRLTRDFEITLLANLITLTPGTMTVDVSADRTHLMIHALDASNPQAIIASIRDGFEAQILEAFRR